MLDSSQFFTSATYLTGFLATAVLSLWLTRLVRNAAIERGWAARPRAARDVHIHPTPRLGGLAIFASFLTVITVTAFISIRQGAGAGAWLRPSLGLLGPALIVFAMGVYDDLRPIGPYRKFAVQALAATLLYLAGFGIHQLDLIRAGRILGAAAAWPLTVFWILLITNAFNLIDGLDGLAAGAALFSTLVFFVVSLFTPHPVLSFFTIVLAGAILGFLKFNFYPASIFLGDSGSMFIGFLLGALALAASQKASIMIAVAIPVVSFGLPILDVLLAVARRFLNGRPLFTADSDHIHHRLLKRGFSQRGAVLTLYVVMAGLALLSLVLLHEAKMLALVLFILGIGIWLGVQHLNYAEFLELQRVVQKTRESRQYLANNLAIRRAIDALPRCADLDSVCSILENCLHAVGFDGFEFEDCPIPCLEHARTAAAGSNGNGGASNGSGDRGAPAAIWELRLSLGNLDGRSLGYLCLLRAHLHQPVLVDFDLLSTELRSALSAVVSRALTLSNGREDDLRVPVPAAKTTAASSRN
ncbi:MAG TPA: MraY family glycosyltransferase [Candidatus Sulfotelmatobacter sp.]|nr:MraY family glycosyltransferase [Candidatus Sulfotelmatobacter sp.]